MTRSGMNKVLPPSRALALPTSREAPFHAAANCGLLVVALHLCLHAMFHGRIAGRGSTADARGNWPPTPLIVCSPSPVRDR